MRLGINIRHLDLPVDRQVAALHKIILNADRYFLQSNLRQMEIPGRTRIYNIFGWSYDYTQTRTDRDEAMAMREAGQSDAVRTILEHSDFRDWAKKYMLSYNINNFLSVFQSANIDLDGFNIKVEREEEHATR
jgi:hypothetical protein